MVVDSGSYKRKVRWGWESTEEEAGDMAGYTLVEDEARVLRKGAIEEGQ